MLGIKQSRGHRTNERLYQRVNQVPIREMIRERQLKFTGHWICMPTDEPINRFVLYESKVRRSLRPGAQTRWKNLRGTNILSCLRRKSLRTFLLSSNDDDDDDKDTLSSKKLQYLILKKLTGFHYIITNYGYDFYVFSIDLL